MRSTSRNLFCMGVLGFFVLSSISVSAATMPTTQANIFHFVDGLELSVARGVLEKRLETILTDTKNGNTFFTFYEGSPNVLNGAFSTADFRQSISPAATVGTILVLTLKPGLCITQTAMRGHYAPLEPTLIGTPRGKSWDETISWRYSRPTAETITFGFFQDTLCLKYIVIEATPTHLHQI